jgi:hypothetical protein
MDPEKTETKPFDPEDTGDLDIPQHVREAAQEAFAKQHAAGLPTFDAEATNELAFNTNGEFYNATDLNLRDDTLDEERRLDMERLAPIVSDKSGSFDQKSLETGVDPVVAQRLVQYEVEKEFFSAPAETFYEQTGLEAQNEAAKRLSEEQQLLLNTVQKLSDGQGFEESHPDLTRSDSVRPTVVAPVEHDPAADAAPLTPLEALAGGNDGAGVQAHLTYEKMQVLTGEKESMDLVDRAKAPRPVVTVDRDALLRRSPPMSTEMKIGIGLVALAIPLFGWSIYMQTNANAEADRMQSQESIALANESADKQSMANQMDEPFRMPSGSTGPTGAPSSGGGDPGNARASGNGSDLASWKPPAAPSPAPTPQQQEEDRKIIALAEQAESLGNTTQAAFMLNAGLGKCPGDIQLVMATARAYMAARDFATARRILQAAMKGARTIGDYAVLQGLLQQIP